MLEGKFTVSTLKECAALYVEMHAMKNMLIDAFSRPDCPYIDLKSLDVLMAHFSKDAKRHSLVRETVSAVVKADRLWGDVTAQDIMDRYPESFRGTNLPTFFAQHRRPKPPTSSTLPNLPAVSAPKEGRTIYVSDSEDDSGGIDDNSQVILEGSVNKIPARGAIPQESPKDVLPQLPQLPHLPQLPQLPQLPSPRKLLDPPPVYKTLEEAVLGCRATIFTLSDPTFGELSQATCFHSKLEETRDFLVNFFSTHPSPPKMNERELLHLFRSVAVLTERTIDREDAIRRVMKAIFAAKCLRDDVNLSAISYIYQRTLSKEIMAQLRDQTYIPVPPGQVEGTSSSESKKRGSPEDLPADIQPAQKKIQTEQPSINGLSPPPKITCMAPQALATASPPPYTSASPTPAQSRDHPHASVGDSGSPKKTMFSCASCASYDFEWIVVCGHGFCANCLLTAVAAKSGCHVCRGSTDVIIKFKR